MDGTLRCRTAQHSIYAAGDVVGRPFLASTGAAQAVAAVGAMFSTVGDYCSLDEGLGATGARYDPASLASNPFQFPVGLWSTPEVAYFGLSKKQADSIGYEADEGLALYKQCLRGVVFAPEGLLKLVFEKGSGRILGVHIAGASAQFNFRGDSPDSLVDLHTGRRRRVRADPLRYGAGARGAHDPVRAGSDVLGRDLPRALHGGGARGHGSQRGPGAATRSRCCLGIAADSPQTGDVQLRDQLCQFYIYPRRDLRHLGDLLALVPRDAVVDVVDLLRHVDQVERDVNRDQVRPRGPDLGHDVQTQ